MSHSGKTTLLRDLQATGAVEVRIDQIVNRLLRLDKPPNGHLHDLAQEFRRIGNRSVSQFVDTASAKGLAEELAELVYAHVPPEHPLVVIEGYGLEGELRARLLERLGSRVIAWNVERDSADEAPWRPGNRSDEPSVEVLKARHTKERAALLNRIAELEAGRPQPSSRQARLPRWLPKGRSTEA